MLTQERMAALTRERTYGVSGAAAAYGLELKHDLTITAADITVKAGMTYHQALHDGNGTDQQLGASYGPWAGLPCGHYPGA